LEHPPAVCPTPLLVIPANAGIHGAVEQPAVWKSRIEMDPGVRRGDVLRVAFGVRRGDVGLPSPG
jgi:hypothetical protein